MQQMNRQISAQTLATIEQMQRNEATESLVYARIAKRVKDAHNREVLENIADDEQRHCTVWAMYTHKEIKPNRLRAWWYVLLSRVLGFTFAVKRMESGEEDAQKKYGALIEEVPEAKDIMEDEDRHENELLVMLDEQRLRYVGSMVLGLNDALVELTGTLAGLTFALQNTQLIALSGLITGVSATLSMASSEFLAARSEGRSDAIRSCIYTGIAYVITVVALVLPYLIFPAQAYVAALGVMLAIVVLIIVLFNYYISVAKSVPFKRRFWEMAAISLGVAAFSFLVGLLIKQVLGVDV